MLHSGTPEDSPNRPLPIRLDTIHLIQTEDLDSRPKARRLAPVPPHPLQSLRTSLPPRRFIHVLAEQAHLEAVLLVPKELLVDRVRDERRGGGGEGEVSDEEGCEELGGEGRGEVPLDAVDEVESADLYVELCERGSLAGLKGRKARTHVEYNA